MRCVCVCVCVCVCACVCVCVCVCLCVCVWGGGGVLCWGRFVVVDHGCGDALLLRERQKEVRSPSLPRKGQSAHADDGCRVVHVVHTHTGGGAPMLEKMK